MKNLMDVKKKIAPNRQRKPSLFVDDAIILINNQWPTRINSPDHYINLKMIQIQDETDKVVEVNRKHETFEFKLDLKAGLAAAAEAVIAFHGPSSIYLEGCIQPDWKVGTLNFSKAKQQALADIYFHQSRLFIIFKQNFNNCVEYYLGEFIFQNFKFQKLIAVDWRPEVLSEEKGQRLEYLKNSLWTLQTFGQKLNGFLTGTTASLLAEAELEKKPAIHFVGIIGDYELTRKEIELFKPLQNYGFASESNTTSTLIKKYNQYKGNGKLYM